MSSDPIKHKLTKSEELSEQHLVRLKSIELFDFYLIVLKGPGFKCNEKFADGRGGKTAI